MKNLTKFSKKRLILYGEYAEIYTYQKGYIYNFQQKNVYKTFGESQQSKSESALARTRQAIYRLIECNKQPRRNTFLTLTFAKNIKDLKMANRDFSKFIMRLNFYLGYRTKYLAVPEFQKRGAVHYHIVFFNLPFIEIKEMNKLWGKGFFKIEESKKINSLGAYVSKYLSKNTFDSRLFGQKAFFTSRNLSRPELIRNESKIDKFLESATIKEVLQFKTYSSFGSETVIIKKVKLKK